MSRVGEWKYESHLQWALATRKCLMHLSWVELSFELRGPCQYGLMLYTTALEKQERPYVTVSPVPVFKKKKKAHRYDSHYTSHTGGLCCARFAAVIFRTRYCLWLCHLDSAKAPTSDQQPFRESCLAGLGTCRAPAPGWTPKWCKHSEWPRQHSPTHCLGSPAFAPCLLSVLCREILNPDFCGSRLQSQHLGDWSRGIAASLRPT